MLVGIIVLARLTDLQYVEDPTRADRRPARPATCRRPSPPSSARRSSATARSLLYVVGAVTALILFLAANTAFNGFPVLGSILAQDRYLPRQLHTRGDRLAFSNGIIFLAVVAMRADRRRSRPRSTRLIQLYIVGVFVSFTLSPDRHDPALEPAAAHRAGPGTPAPDDRSRAINAFGLVHDRRRADHRAGHEVPARRVDRDRRDAGHLLADASASSRHYDRVAQRAGADRGAAACCRPATTPSCWSARCTCRRCGRWPTPRRPGRTRSPRSPSTSTTKDTRAHPGGVGAAAASRCR